jgi:uncharacterized protein (TIGR04141 family)
LHKHLLNLDQVKLNPTGMSGANLEPCDFFSSEKQFIHLKDGHGSAPISHLWNQGVVSAESLVRDKKFRKDLRHAAKRRQKKLKKSGFDTLLPDERSKLNPADFAVVFAIMRGRYKKSGKLGIPFFSKISRRPAAERIRLMGFNVEVHLVEKLQGNAVDEKIESTETADAPPGPSTKRSKGTVSPRTKPKRPTARPRIRSKRG